MFSKYISTIAILVNENHQHFQGWNPTTREKKMRFNIFSKNNTNCNKEHLLCSIVITSTPQWFVSDRVGRASNKILHKQLISNRYKY